ncbi:hypothetical protein LPJ61_001612 [Coemansia biformis]|uniref:Uncharacterized protein n=1 Tax=Coemansia biformis TaxID=1286918 RepID=A0A9W7YGD5_9FUNG|nr:hypothetical protein LPJ61_001612 [Coemansia biformis]
MPGFPTQGRLRRYALGALLCMAVVLVLRTCSTTQKPTAEETLDMYTDALNKTLGFHQIYVIHEGGTAAHGVAAFGAVAELLDMDVQYILHTAHADAAAVARAQHGFLTDTPRAAELDIHAQVYADMVRRGIQSALILVSDADVELDIKERLAAALAGSSPHLHDMLFVGRAFSEPAEPEADELAVLLQQTNGTDDRSAQMQRLWAKRNFLHRPIAVFRSSSPRGIHAYALNAHMAHHLHRRLGQRMGADAHGLDYVLADAALTGLCAAYSVSPPLVVAHGRGDRNTGNQFLRRSARYAIGLRSDDPSHYPPFLDWQDMWG